MLILTGEDHYRLCSNCTLFQVVIERSKFIGLRVQFFSKSNYIHKTHNKKSLMNLNFYHRSLTLFFLINFFKYFFFYWHFFVFHLSVWKNRSETKIVTSCLIWIDFLSNTLTNFKSGEKVFCFYISLFAYNFDELSTYWPLSMLPILVSDNSQRFSEF